MGQMMVCDNWEIQLRQWDRRKTTLEAKDKLINSAPYQVESTIRVAANAPVGYPETCRIVLAVDKYLTQYPYV
ncbi:MAG: hypothetical protein WAN66_22120 [Limnoraphis robusta]